jgi:hypothetical protein
MTIAFDRWTSAEIAGAAAILAATVAAVASFVAAAVNAWSARRLARETARREFRLNIATPYLDLLDRFLILHRDLCELGTIIATTASTMRALLASSQHDALRRAQAALQLQTESLSFRLTEFRDAHRNTGLILLVLSDQNVVDAFLGWTAKNTAVLQALLAGGLTITPEQQQALDSAASDAFKQAVQFRTALEAFIFGDRGLLRRGSYYVWSKARAAMRRIRNATQYSRGHGAPRDPRKVAQEMEMPTLPTDSLYKCKAIGGIVLTLGALYVAFQATATAIHVTTPDGALLRLCTRIYELMMWFCAGTVLIGGGYTWLGFREWRLRIQEPQDELLQIQLHHARLSIAGARHLNEPEVDEVRL